MIIQKSAAEIQRMAEAGRIVSDTIALLGEHVRPGARTEELDALADEFIRSRGGAPTFKGYRGYPASVCLSPNDMVVHGIPGAYELEEGDVLSVDVGVTLEGFVADSAFTFPVGQISSAAERLLEACQAALEAGIEQARPANRVGDISSAVQRAAESRGFSVIKSLVGHGVGRSMHEDPQVPNFGDPGHGPRLQTGMTIAIEPMLSAGSPEVFLHEDGWSISTSDGSLSAHFEHTVAITDGGPRILTAPTEVTGAARAGRSAPPLAGEPPGSPRAIGRPEGQSPPPADSQSSRDASGQGDEHNARSALFRMGNSGTPAQATRETTQARLR